MKKAFFLLLFAAMQITSFAKENVYLKNGSMIKGEIVEFVPNQSIKVETSDGSIFVCKYDEIEKIVREKNETTESKSVKQGKDYPSHIKRGYRGFVSSEYFIGSLAGLAITTSHGFQFNKKIFLGMGTGFRFGGDYDYDHYTIPVFLDFRFDILDYKISPFMTTRAGACISVNDGPSGFYASYDFGCRFKRFSVSTGIETCRGTEYEWYGSDYYYHEYYNDYQAFNFVTRVSWEF